MPPDLTTSNETVAPLAGAWIEILSLIFLSSLTPSLPSRERGLKSRRLQASFGTVQVAPLAGAWIEILRLLGNCFP